MMNVEEFVAETLKQVINGVLVAQEHAADRGALVNPESVSYDHFPNYHAPVLTVAHADGNTLIREIAFDLAITVQESDKLEAGAGLFIPSFALGAKTKAQDQNSLTNRIQFTVPVVLPSQSNAEHKAYLARRQKENEQALRDHLSNYRGT